MGTTPEKLVFVKDLKPGESVADVFVIVSAGMQNAKNGPYWNLLLQDKTGKVEAKIWSPLSRSYEGLTSGDTALVEGMVQTFREKLQINIERMQLLDPESEVPDPGLMYPSSQDPPELMLARLRELCRKNLFYPPWRKLIESLFGDTEVRERFMTAPGGKMIHHAYLGGLLEHTLSVARLCLDFCEHFQHLDKEILLVAAVLHDLGKAWEYGSGMQIEVTDQGRLLGHIYLGLEIVESHLVKCEADPELVMHLRHLILSHHGEYEFGSPRRPKTAEAFALHYADNLDAKQNQIKYLFSTNDEEEADEEAGEEAAVGPAWSPYQRSLERFIYRPKPTPGAEGLNGKNKKQESPKENQCSLPLKG